MQEKREANVIPVILRPSDWRNTPFGHLLAIPKDGKPIVKFTRLDEAFLEITTEIKRVIEPFSLPKEPNVRSEQKNDKSSTSLPRSSNLKIPKKFSDHEKDQFIDNAFDYIANFFEGSLVELKNRSSHVDYRYKRVDSQTFHAYIY